MIHKFQAVFVTTTSPGTPTSPVELGADNCAMFEVWLASTSTAAVTVNAYMDGSNDGTNWWSTPLTSTTVGPTYPAYTSVPYSTAIPYSHVRLRFALASAATALLDATVRTFRTS